MRGAERPHVRRSVDPYNGHQWHHIGPIHALSERLRKDGVPCVPVVHHGRYVLKLKDKETVTYLTVGDPYDHARTEREAHDGAGRTADGAAAE